MVCVFQQNMELCLNTQLLLTKFGNEDGCPFALPSVGVDSIHQHANIISDILQNLCKWKLFYIMCAYFVFINIYGLCGYRVWHLLR